MEPQIIELNGKKYKVTYEEIKKPVSGFHREKGQYYWAMNGYDGTPLNTVILFHKEITQLLKLVIISQQKKTQNTLQKEKFFSERC